MNGVVLRVTAIAVAVLGLAFALKASHGDAESRTNAPPYELYRPAGLSRSNPVPLVIGIGGTPTKKASGFNGFADRYGFVVAYPDPFPITVPGSTDGDGQNATARIKYVSDVIDEVTASENIDPKRVYVTGGSKSGIESYRLACRLSTKIAAIGSVAGSLPPRDALTCKPSRPVSILEIHGTADAAVPYNGNQLYPPVRTTLDFWRKLAGCPTQAAMSTRGRVTTETWSRCRGGIAVSLVTYTGGGHGWPRNRDIDTSAELWAFFSAHSAAVPFSASVSRLSVSGGSFRLLTIRLTVNEDAMVRASLVRKGRSYSAKTFKIAAGNRILRLAIPKRARPGTYALSLGISTSTGSKQTIRKSVRIR